MAVSKGKTPWDNDKTFRGTRLGREPALFWVIPESRIINHYRMPQKGQVSVDTLLYVSCSGLIYFHLQFQEFDEHWLRACQWRVQFHITLFLLYTSRLFFFTQTHESGTNSIETERHHKTWLSDLTVWRLRSMAMVSRGWSWSHSCLDAMISQTCQSHWLISHQPITTKPVCCTIFMLVLQVAVHPL